MTHDRGDVADRIGLGLAYAALALLALFVLLPLLATVLGGLKTLGELRQNPFSLPLHPRWSNLTTILSGGRYWRLLGNSMLIAGFVTAITVMLAGMAAFVLAHIRFFGREMLMGYLMLGLMFPAATAMLPLFIQIRDFGLLDSYAGLILAEIAFSLSMSILLFRNFFRQLPGELFDAARMDGCGYARMCFAITLPLCRPIVTTVGIVTFVTSWNNYMLPLILLDTPGRYPWPLGIMDYQGQYSMEWQLVLAFITLTILPAVLVFILAQKHIVAGLTAGAVKG